MGVYPGSETERRVGFDALRRLVTEVFRSCTMSADDAALLSETLAVSDLRGVHSHGVLRVPEYVSKLATGGVDPGGRPRVLVDNGAVLLVDGGNSMGQIGADFAMARAIERARATGVAVAAVKGSNHCGAMAYFAMKALAHDMIGLATTNALPTMAPWGGTDKIIGINPLAVAVPAAEERPLVMDLAFAGSSHGKIRVYAQKGAPIPEDWAFDTDGRPTTDPQAALDGLLRPIGGFKGMNLAIVMGVLSTVLSGASYGTALGNMVDGPEAGRDGHFLMALSLGALRHPDAVKAQVDTIIGEIRASRLAPGVDRVYAPGELEAETQERYMAQGIPLNADTLDALADVAMQRGVDPRPLGRS